MEKETKREREGEKGDIVEGQRGKESEINGRGVKGEMEKERKGRGRK